MRRLTALRTHLAEVLGSIRGNDLGYSAEATILTGLMAAIGLTVGGIFRDEIVAAARSITFTG
ncbi:hypothetical protein [Streptomyces phytophilus]|uniref:hypothetical protein n=1 Tax=Streptomyces phytophilus TaxID=722715 RepID=UPI0015F063A8|nr:hypothetical protein [Streptomyces phytophilus]